MIIDTHCHFDMMSQPEAYIRQKEQAGDIVIGMTNLPSHFEMGLPHVKRYKHIRLALGLHPLLASENKNELPLFDSLLDQTSYIGEIGLDFSKEGLSTKEDQISTLRKLLEKLEGRKKIISVHSRKAEKELFDLLCEYNINNVIFHWYSGPIDLIPSIISKGYYFSINEAMTISKMVVQLSRKSHEVEYLQNQTHHLITKWILRKRKLTCKLLRMKSKQFMELLSKIK